MLTGKHGHVVLAVLSRAQLRKRAVKKTCTVDTSNHRSYLIFDWKSSTAVEICSVACCNKETGCLNT